jgi:hypothetical protein
VGGASLSYGICQHAGFSYFWAAGTHRHPRYFVFAVHDLDVRLSVGKSPEVEFILIRDEFCRYFLDYFLLSVESV